MKKTVFLLSFMLFIINLFGCENKDIESKEVELLSDNNFRNGFSIAPADKSPMPDNRYPLPYELRYNGNEDEPIQWNIAQWGCVHGIADEYALSGKEPDILDESFIFEDYSKKIIVNPSEGIITLELNASKEYIEPRINGEGWSHLIMEQGLIEQPLISEVDSITLNMDILLNKSELYMTDEEYNASLHTAQYIMYIVIQSNAAKDAGEFMWFGIPIYDARYLHMDERGQADAGTSGNTGKFIYQMPTLDYMPNGITVGEKIHINIDLIPYMRRAIDLANEKGFMINTTVDDLFLTSMNIGFEVPGTYDVSVELSNFSLLAVYN